MLRNLHTNGLVCGLAESCENCKHTSRASLHRPLELHPDSTDTPECGAQRGRSYP